MPTEKTKKPATVIPDAADLQCPDEKYKITIAVCAARQKRHYEKCEGCPNRKPSSTPSMALTGRRR